jgi:Asp-tRNA(Asn)/Glu-tRNA(Gln) amidotransferase A subunit family amidase
MQQGLFVPATAYLKAQRIRAVVVHDVERMFQEVDLLATLTAAVPAPKLDVGSGEIAAPTGVLRSML